MVVGGICMGGGLFLHLFLRKNNGKDLRYCGAFHLYKNKTKEQFC